MAAMRREMDRTDEPVAALAIDSLLLELLAELRRLGGNGGTVSALPDAATAPGKAAPPWLLKAREMVCDTYVAPPELEQIATVVGVHPVSLARAFRRHFGETVGDCVRRRRIEAACQQMVATDAALTHIAFEAGFADQAHFTRTFQRHIGMPPSEYARQFRRSAKLTRAG
jgi:AraC family transcriptional regulator